MKFTMASGHCFRYLCKLENLGGQANILSIKKARSYQFNVDGELATGRFWQIASVL